MRFPLRTFHSALFLLVSGLVLIGCSSGRSYTETGLAETLETEILADGSKMFVYRLRWPEDQIPNHVRVAKSRVGPDPYQRKGVEVNRYTYERIRANAEHVVARKGYCREGYLELDGSVSRYHMWLKGECRDTASEEDRARFPGQQILPMKSG
jgi:hypothetical protein